MLQYGTVESRRENKNIYLCFLFFINTELIQTVVELLSVVGWWGQDGGGGVRTGVVGLGIGVVGSGRGWGSGRGQEWKRDSSVSFSFC